MKKLITIVFSAIFIAFAGCKSIPTPAQAETTSYAIGVSAALVCNMTDLSSTNAQVIVDILNKIKVYTPKPNQSLYDAWNSIATDYVNTMIADGKITTVDGDLILQVFKTVANSIDYIATVRWPKIAEYSYLVEAVAHGFCDGFLSTFNVGTTKMRTNTCADYDKDAYDYLLKNR